MIASNITNNESVLSSALEIYFAAVIFQDFYFADNYGALNRPGFTLAFAQTFFFNARLENSEAFL